MCDSCDWQQAIKDIDEILETLPDLPERAFDFASGVSDTLESIRAWILENEHVTEPQADAIENIDAGVQKWL